MRTISFMNLKGGVGKTTTAINMAMLLSDLGYKVLLVDNDPQGSASKFFGIHDYDKESMEDILSGREKTEDVIQKISDNLSMITANMNMDIACQQLMSDSEEEQNTKLKNALHSVNRTYDFCVIDCQPGMGLNTINALVATDDIVIPVKLDKQSLDGVAELDAFVDEAKVFNSEVKIVKCLVTIYQGDMLSICGKDYLQKNHEAFNTVIRFSSRVNDWTYEEGTSLCSFSPRCNAARDYKQLVKEYLKIIGTVEK